MARYVSYRDFDWILLGFVLLICGMGVMEIHSATMHTKFAGAHIKQVYWVAAGVGAMFLVSLVNYQALLEQIHWFYIASVASLMAVMIFGQKYLGAKRWIKMPGGNHFQPSEWVKLILILAVAKYFADMRQRGLTWPDFMKAGAIVGIPMLMVRLLPICPSQPWESFWVGCNGGKGWLSVCSLWLELAPFSSFPEFMC
jgi:rod shape determining protein RodA